MTGDSFFQWMIKEFFDTSKYPPGKTLLVLELYASHRTEVALSLLRRQEIDVFFVPTGCTALVQLMDLAVNRPFKQKYKELFAHWRAATRTQKRPPTRRLITQFVAAALASVETSAYEKSFCKIYVPALQRDLQTVPISAVEELRANTLVVTATTQDTDEEPGFISLLAQTLTLEDEARLEDEE